MVDYSIVLLAIGPDLVATLTGTDLRLSGRVLSIQIGLTISISNARFQYSTGNTLVLMLAALGRARLDTCRDVAKHDRTHRLVLMLSSRSASGRGEHLNVPLLQAIGLLGQNLNGRYCDSGCLDSTFTLSRRDALITMTTSLAQQWTNKGFLPLYKQVKDGSQPP